MPSSAARRVSFSNRVFYSDDGSTTTVTTDDDLYRDDGSFLSNSDDDDSLGDDDEGVESETEAHDDALEVSDDDEEEEETAEEDNMKEDDMSKTKTEEVSNKKETTDKKEVCEEDSDESWDPLEDAPPLVIRDVGIYERPSEYLGGYGPECSESSPHRVKFRKSWVADSKGSEGEEEEEKDEHAEFEEWKKARVAEATSKKRAKAIASKKIGKVDKNLEEEIDNSTALRKTPPKNDAVEKKDDTLEKVAAKKNTVPEQMEKPQAKMNTSEEEDVKKTPKDIENKSKTPQDKVKPTKERVKRKPSMKKTASSKVIETPKTEKKVPMPVVKKPKENDAETKAQEKEILLLKEKIGKLQRELDVIEVRTISQLADLEEETTKRMRQYRLKADDVVRKKRAKEEKQNLKEQAMKSQDLVEHLRRSNQKLRSEGMKMQDAVAELKKSNQLLEEKNSFHRDYAAQFRSFQKVEVSLAEEMNRAFNRDVPKYERLIRGMEEGVADREASGLIERNGKELYLNCMQSILTMLDESCTDDSLVDKVAIMMDESDEESGMEESANENEDENTMALDSTKPVRRNGSKSFGGSEMKTLATDSPKKLIKRKSDGGAISPTKATIRRSNSTTASGRRTSDAGRRGSSQQKRPVPRRSSSSTYRIPRSPRKSVSKLVSDDDDDSSTCSITSVQSDNYSLSEFAN